MTPEKAALLQQGNEVCILSPVAKYQSARKGVILLPQCAASKSWRYGGIHVEEGRGHVGVVIQNNDGSCYVEAVRVQDVRCLWSEHEAAEKARKAGSLKRAEEKAQTTANNKARFAEVNRVLREKGVITGPDYYDLGKYGEGTVGVSIDQLEKMLGLV